MNWFKHINLNSFKIKPSFFYLIVAFVFLMPLYKISASPFIILFSIFSLYKIFKTNFKVLNHFFDIKLNILFTILISLLAFSLFYSSNLEVGFKHLKESLPLILFPILLHIYKLDKNQILILLKSFLIGCLFAFFISIFSQFYNIYKGLEYSFYYIDLVKLIWMHPTYLSLYLNFAILISYYLFIEKEYNVYMLLFNVIIFTIFILLLSARMQIINLAIVYFLIFTNFIKNRFSLKMIFIILSISILGFIAIKNNTHLKNRFSYIQNLKYNYTQNDKSWNGANVRLAIWNSSFDVIKRNIFLGVGIGDEDEKLIETFKLNSFSFAHRLKYVAHNQYVQFLISVGLIGLSIYISIFIFLFRRSIIDKNFLLFSLLILLIFTGLTESYLRMQSGIVFFTFMIILIFQLNNFSIILKND